MDDEAVAPIPNPAVQQQLFLLVCQGISEDQRSEALTKLLENIEKDGASPYIDHRHGAVL